MNTRDRLAERLGARRTSWNPEELAEIVADLLPVVEQIAAEHAAEELEAAADSTKSWPRSVMSDSVGAKLRSRAAGLTDKDGQR